MGTLRVGHRPTCTQGQTRGQMGGGGRHGQQEAVPGTPALCPAASRAADRGASPRPCRRTTTPSVSLWSGSTSWATTRTPPGGTGRGPAGLGPGAGPVPRGCGTCRSTARAGPAGASRRAAHRSPRCSCPACWTTRTTRWCGCCRAGLGPQAAPPGRQARVPSPGGGDSGRGARQAISHQPSGVEASCILAAWTGVHCPTRLTATHSSSPHCQD